MAIIPYTQRASSVPSLTVSDRVGNLYGVSGGDVIKYVAATGSSSNLGNPGSHIQSITWFNGFIHCLWWDGTNVLTDITDLGVSYYNGSGWVQTLTKPVGTIGAFLQEAQLMALRDVVMVAHIGAFGIGSAFIPPLIYFTTNGTSWNDGTVEGSDSVFLQQSANGTPVLYTDAIYLDGNTDHLNVNPPFTTQLWKWVAGDWIVIDNDYSTEVSGSYPRLIAGYIDKMWQDPSSATGTEYSNTLLSWATTPNSADGPIVPVPGDNLPRSFGQFFNGVSFYMIPWDDSVLAWEEIDYDNYNRTTYGAPSKMFRMNDGTVFVVTAGGYILQRDSDIPESPEWNDPVPGFGALYWGTNLLTNSKALIV